MFVGGGDVRGNVAAAGTGRVGLGGRRRSTGKFANGSVYQCSPRQPCGNVIRDDRCAPPARYLLGAPRALVFEKCVGHRSTPRATRSRAIGHAAAGVSLEDILEELITERTSRFRGLGAAFSRRSARSLEGSSHGGRHPGASRDPPVRLPSRRVPRPRRSPRAPPLPPRRRSSSPRMSW